MMGLLQNRCNSPHFVILIINKESSLLPYLLLKYSSVTWGSDSRLILFYNKPIIWLEEPI